MESIIEKFHDLVHIWNPEPASIYIVKLFAALIASLLSMNLNSWAPPLITNLNPDYDFIIIGGGTAGIVVASSLSTSLSKLGYKDATILVIEAGKKAPLTSEIPYFVGNMKGTQFDWNYLTVPQEKACKGYVEESCHISQGKLLGGSVMIQPSSYTIGTKRDFNRWLNMENPSWGWSDVLPYFEKFMERVRIRSFDDFLGKHGDKIGKLKDTILYAAQFLNYNALQSEIDVITNKIGYGKLFGTLSQGKMNHPGRTFLVGAMKSKMIQVVRKCLVQKIEIDTLTKSVVGVQVSINGDPFKIQSIRTRKEVILCAGAINNPKLLMLSGIGPKAHLQDLDIKVILNLAGVGQNLQDHVHFPGKKYVTQSIVESIDSKYRLDSIVVRA